ncbi:MAG: lactate dehydrogenase-like 2-hydroxyacid dehydrogenase [Candidatus Aldehydirespiratoraceae bacterium]
MNREVPSLAGLRVVVTRPDLPGDGITKLRASGADVTERNSHDQLAPGELRHLLKRADGAIVTGMDPVTSLDLADLTQLRAIATASTGTNHIDLAAAADGGVAVMSVNGADSEACADYTFGLIIGARRRLVEHARRVGDGQWNQHTMHTWLSADVSGAQLGLIGFGRIAHAVARRARGFDMRVVHHDRSRSKSPLSTWVDLQTLLETSDIVSVHAPLTDATHHLIDDTALRSMKHTATLINTSRGGIVDTTALVDALTAGRLHSAALDVIEGEPLGPVDERLLKLDSLIITPHAAAATTAVRSEIVASAVNQLLDVLRAAPRRHAHI